MTDNAVEVMDSRLRGNDENHCHQITPSSG